MLLLCCEHYNEAKPFIEYFKAQKQRNLYLAKGIAIYVNFGKGALSLAFEFTKLNEILKPDLSILFGTAGNISDLKIGDIIIAKKIKLFDTNLSPLLNPVELNTINGFKNVDCISVFGNYALNKDLSNFGDCIDMEAYFFAKALNQLNAKGFIVKLISDNNDIIKKLITIDYTRVLNVINTFKTITDNNLTEIFFKTRTTDLNVLFGLKKLFEKKHYTFTMRQNIYKKIVVNTSKITKTPFKLKCSFSELPVEKKYIKISDYVGIFHNLKDKCAVIFANKKGEFLRKTPDHYTPQGTYGYSILQSYNCIYDCSYCFLKGYFKSFNPVIFKNIQDYFVEIKKTLKKDKLRPMYFYFGTFSDPIALSIFDKSYIKFAEFFENLDAILEIRTKSANIKELLQHKPFKNTIIAFSLAPQNAIEKFEYFTPNLTRRIEALKLLDNAGFNIGIRFDPFFCEFLNQYESFVSFLKQLKHLHSIEIGFLRFSKNEYKIFLDKNPAILSGMILKNNMYLSNKIENIKYAIQNIFSDFKDKIYYNMC
ncbi:spore photoproduct lyase family protein [Desulfurella sp.]|uniref:spore photoproduct lyase family protein n=1 Tax=Desulfurella sp. TaxID=1962857 RepID=UPI0025BD445A|nr:hypothetical protein [Desulfurella sp.]